MGEKSETGTEFQRGILDFDFFRLSLEKSVPGPLAGLNKTNTEAPMPEASAIKFYNNFSSLDRYPKSHIHPQRLNKGIMNLGALLVVVDPPNES